MSSFLKNIGQAKGKDIQGDKDTLGGGFLMESDLYHAVVKALYLSKSKKGGDFVNLIADIDGKEYRESFYAANPNGEPFYTNDKGTFFYPGYNVVNAIAQLTTGFELADLDEPEDKELEVWDGDAKAMVRKTFPCFTQTHGEEIKFGILKQIVDKTAEDKRTGKYEPTGETREENIIDKCFHVESEMTVQEYEAEQEEAAFVTKWLNKNQGVTANKAKGKAEGKAGAPAGAGNAAAKPKSSLFNRK